jgi:hypothetical protein
MLLSDSLKTMYFVSCRESSGDQDNCGLSSLAHTAPHKLTNKLGTHRVCLHKLM